MDRVDRMNERMQELGDLLAEHRVVHHRQIDDLSLQMEAVLREDNHQMSELSARIGNVNARSQNMIDRITEVHRQLADINVLSTSTYNEMR